MKRIFLIAFLLALLPGLSYGANACTSAGTGNWNAPATWANSGGCDGATNVPGDGDTATVGHNVTVSVNQTIGSSPGDATTNVLTISGATGRVIIADGITLTVRGNISNNCGAVGTQQVKGINLGAGSSLVFDASAATPTTQRYNITTGQYCQIYAAGTSGAHATITTLSGASTWSINAAQGTNAALDATYTDFSYCGAATQYCAYLSSSSACGPIRMDHCTSVSSGTWSLTQAADTADLYLRDASFNLTLAATNTLLITGRSTSSSVNEVIRISVDKLTSITNPNNFTVQNSYFGTGISSTTGSFTNFSYNLYRTVGSSGGANNFYATAASCYFVSDAKNTNPSILNWNTTGANRSITESVIDFTGTVTNGDFIFPYCDTAHTLAFNNNILIPGAVNQAGGKPLSIVALYTTGTARSNGANPSVVTGTGTTWSAANVKAGDLFKDTNTGTYMSIASRDSNIQITLTGVYTDPGSAVNYEIDRTELNSISIGHNTYVSTGSTAENGMGIGETDSGTAGEITSFKSNLAWTPSGKDAGFLLSRQQSVRQDFVLSENADYNWCYGCATVTCGAVALVGYNCQASYTSTEIFSSGTPDAHTGTSDPKFVDTNRYFVNFDSQFMGNVAPATWDGSAGPFVAGDIVSNTDANQYAGMVINYRCIANHNKGVGNDEPGVGSSWRTYWEFASAYRLRTTPILIRSLIDWVRYGYSPTNGLLRKAGHDGATIGAMEWQNPRRKRIM
jgi:hypothetical protein